MKVVLTPVIGERNSWFAKVAIGNTAISIDDRCFALDPELLDEILITVDAIKWQISLRDALVKLNAKVAAESDKVADPWRAKCNSLAAAQRLRKKSMRACANGKKFNGLNEFPTAFWGTPRLETGSALKRMLNQANNRRRRQSSDDWKQWCDNTASNIRKRA